MEHLASVADRTSAATTTPPNEQEGEPTAENPVPARTTITPPESGAEDGLSAVNIAFGRKVKLPAFVKSTPLSVIVISTDPGAVGPIVVHEIDVGERNTAGTGVPPTRHPNKSLDLNKSPVMWIVVPPEDDPDVGCRAMT